MKRFLIEEIRHEEGDAMLTCTPPIMHPVIASIRYTSENDSAWLYCMKIMEFYEFYQSEKDIHDQLLSLEDEELLDKHHIDEFNGIPLEVIANAEIDFDELPESANWWVEFASNPAFNLIRCAMRLSDEWEKQKAEPLIKTAKGHYSDELVFSGFDVVLRQ